MSGCFKKNDLILSGTPQDNRETQALDTKYVLPDERTLAALMVFISKYAKSSNYYAASEKKPDYSVEGNWSPLILSDESFSYAAVSTSDFPKANATFYNYVNKYETVSGNIERFNAYRVWWDILISV